MFLASTPALAAYDANGVTLGASEAQIKKAYPSVHCKPLEWKSDAADRRCDDAKVSFGGTEVRVTFYLRKNAVQAFDIRFDTKDLERVAAHARQRYGKPLAEGKESIERSGKEAREIFKARWENGQDRAVLVAQMEKKRSALTVSRGDFEEEIYRVK
jgi:hypothetical protein